jgi:hypothetical protein
MTLHTHAGPLPAHQYVWIDADAIGKHEPLRAVWFGLTSWPWEPWQAATWDAYGWQFTTLEYPYLSSMNTRVRLQDGAEHAGMYLFTLAPVGDAFSASPSQSKEFYFLQLENGRYTAQPTNQVLVDDRSWVDELKWPTFLKRQRDWHSAEDRE